MSQQPVVQDFAQQIFTPISSDSQTNIIDQVIVSEDPSSSFSLIYVAIIILIVLVLLKFFKSKKKNDKRQISLIGQRDSGKTQLWIKLNGGKSINTVPSIKNNSTRIQYNDKQFEIIDYMGDNLSKEEVLGNIDKIHTLVLVIDGCNSKKLGDAALFLYRIMISKSFQKEGCNVVLFLNKNDETTFYGEEKLVKKLQEEIDTIKYSKRNQLDENDNEEDFLKTSKQQFKLKKHDIKIVSGSSQSNIKGLQLMLNDLI